MSNFNGTVSPIVPSEFGEGFNVDTQVTFSVHGKKQTGIIVKQLKNSAVVELDETQSNTSLMVQSNGVVVINYKHLTKL
ncbi:hypothetical protein ACSFB8_01620 [Enterococcus faecalis]